MKDLEAQIAAMEAGAPPPVTLPPRASDLFASLVGQLHERLSRIGQATAGEPTDRERELVEAIRALVVRIDVEPESDLARAPLRIKLVGDLAAFVSDHRLPTVPRAPGPRKGWVSW